MVQEHRYSFDVDATPEEIWGVMHQRPTERPSGRGEIGEFGPIRQEDRARSRDDRDPARG